MSAPYERKEPIPPREDRFENFYIRYDVWSTKGPDPINTAVCAEVWEVCEWDGNTPVFFNGGPGAPVTDPTKVEPLFHLRVGWDGCSHLNMPYLHFDGVEEFEKFGNVVKYIYDDICDKADLMD